MPGPLSAHILNFLSNLSLTTRLPKGVVAMNPYREPEAWKLCQQFYSKFFTQGKDRILILGINPGRHGGGITGIPFTDPVKLREDCGIPNAMGMRTELSADFIYRMIKAYGGPQSFYEHFYISAISPIGFTKDDKNLNYYDLPDLEKKVRPFIVDSMHQQLAFGLRSDVAFCLGEGKNFKYLTKLNEEYKFFKKVVPLAHPRFIMQYRRKKIDAYVAHYLSVFKASQ